MPETPHIRWIWPDRSRCPDCATRDYRNGGYRGRKQYRVCKNPDCKCRYFVLPCAEEVDRGGMTSIVEPV